MAYISRNKQGIFGLPLRHGHGIKATVLRIGNLRENLRKSGNIQAAYRQSGQDNIDQIGRETKLFPRKDIAVFGKDFFIHQRNCLPVEHGKKNLPGIGLKIQQGGNQHVGISIAA